MTSHRSHGCRPPARQHNRAPVYVRTYVRTFTSLLPPTHVFRVYICVYTMDDRTDGSRELSRDALAIVAHSSVRDQSCRDYDSNDRVRLLFNIRLEFVLSAIRISAYYIYICCIGTFFRIHFSPPFFYLFKIVCLGF